MHFSGSPSDLVSVHALAGLGALAGRYGSQARLIQVEVEGHLDRALSTEVEVVC